MVFMLNMKAMDVTNDIGEMNYLIKTNSGTLTASLVCNSTGRRSNLIIKEKTKHFIDTNYVGIKYHIKLERDPNLIEIHNFPGGYCGISNVEENKSCLCYIVNSKKLNSVHNSIPALEKTYLFRRRMDRAAAQ